ncbi:MAG: hypothetical protein L0Z53_28110 [Acidobacteriales bacterium]|nr:hypothetical protein [Terriglobales bacterium]
MKLHPAMTLGVVAGVLSLPIMLSAARLNSASSRLTTASLNLEQTIQDAQRILELRAKQQTIAEHKRPDQDVIARVNTVLAESGITSDRFGGLRPESDAAVPHSKANGAAYGRQSVRITLNELSVSQVGAFLARWSQTQPLWIPSRIELTHSRSATDAGQYTLNLLLSATYVSEPEPS